MDSFNSMATQQTATDAALQGSENQAQEAKSYSQKEVDDMMARMKSSIMKKVTKPYEDLGDPEELRQLKSEAEQRRTAEQLKRGEFEKTLQELAHKKDQEIQKRDSIIKEYKVNSPLISAAAKYRAVNADQVKALLSNNVRLNDDGEVEVVDHRGTVRYNDRGEPLGVDDLVREFLDSNPHFVSATPATINSRSNINQGPSEGIDITKLDMSLAAHRKIYAQARAQQKI
jgi:hypothetical protein